MLTKTQREPIDTEMRGKATTGSWKASADLGPASPGGRLQGVGFRALDLMHNLTLIV